MKKSLFIAFLFGFIFCQDPGMAQKKKSAAKAPEKKETGLNPATFRGLKFRSIGPAWQAGRISDFAVIRVTIRKYMLVFPRVTYGNQ